jgi:hypothetical protein
MMLGRSSALRCLICLCHCPEDDNRGRIKQKQPGGRQRVVAAAVELGLSDAVAPTDIEALGKGSWRPVARRR